ncbi:TRAP transporter large permease [Pelagibacterium halotolerans]|uniref:TRAP transporter large permease protein n=1 Tax=Pelagibacterium halotolerans (strain DSM 22347 / JCM 15775 / CGMCC 1.7692 / B2) TaxID=1082931 RepID=G4RCB2_PELHB|nr:TRAP transporter large permease [Pelagibacterium halotolerans]AEQ53706.1 TRAP dicarboxylate transporter, DctM subunit [Pelagibacterium halotolerans B2]QJR20131.1 TRAP transporter large permease [Pelagibacterium halotolerans]SEA79254.1 TRAP transporter, DctM subunit [Pelagibacterium halotolerans]
MIWYVAIGLAVLLALSVPVGAALFLLGFGLDAFFAPLPLIRGLGQMVYSSSDSFLLIAIPLFVLLGEILVRAGIAERTYKILDAWFSWLPGGLVHANIGTSTMFSATSGSSVATAATVATVAMPQAKKQGYDQRLFAGAIAAGGTLGIMLPPSINLIVYGFLTQTSVPQLFMAGIVPGLLMALGFMAITIIICSIKPELGGPSRHFTWRERLAGLPHLIPVFLVFAVIIGSIYNGWATPTEAAAVGVAMAMLIAAFYRSLTLDNLKRALLGTIRTTAMVMFVIVGAYFLNYALGATGLGRQLTLFLEGMGLGPYGMLLVIILMYIVLGFFIETLALMIATIPIVVPIIIELGFDKVWFGILLIVLIEMALITPPVGLNLYVVQGARKEGRLSDVMVGVIPFVFVMLVMVALLVAFPAIALVFSPA